MYVLYSILAMVAVLGLMPMFLYRLMVEPGFAQRLRESFGWWSDEEVAKVAGKGCIWIHGASVGEIVATSPLVKAIRTEWPDKPILVSAVTTGGYAMAKSIIPEADAIIYFPLDLPWVVSRIVPRVRPCAFLPVETELWPNFLRAVAKEGIPVMMVNGRISDRSVKRYHYLFTILHDMLRSVRRFCMQSALDAEYIIRLGADPKMVVVTGNTKFDQTYAEVTEADKVRYRTEMGLDSAWPVIVAGSTHDGEEEPLLKAFAALRQQYPKARLLLAPRKVLRSEEVAGLAERMGFQTARRSQTHLVEEQAPVILLDTIGELGRLYALGDIVFVGGSLIEHGGHNVLEPAAHGKPILVGPHMFNFKDSYQLLTNCGACRMIKNGTEMLSVMEEILRDEVLREKMGRAALQVIVDNRGAAARSVVHLREVLVMESGVKAAKNCARHELVRQYLFRLIHDETGGPFDFIVLALLRASSVLYSWGVCLKLAMYRSGFLQQHRLPATVISIGNITVGGTGKTPTAQMMAQMIKDMGYKVVILNRGYRAHWQEEVGLVSDGRKIYMTAYEAGDEAYLLAKTLPGIPVVIGKDRSISGRYAVEKLGAQVIILDDGYQHWQLARDLDIVLIDSLNVFGNTHLLPRGTLREPLSHLDRADIFVLTKTDQATGWSREYLRNVLKKYNPAALVSESIHNPCYFIEIADWYKGIQDKNCPLTELEGREVLAFSAIGNPSSFEQTLSDIGLHIVDTVRYPDHHDYGVLEMQSVTERAVAKNAYALVTTAKDAVKIPTEFIYSDRDRPLYVLGMEIKITDGEEALRRRLIEAIQKGENK